MSSEVTVTTPPEVVRTLASSTVFVNASRRVNRDFGGMLCGSGGSEARGPKGQAVGRYASGQARNSCYFQFAIAMLDISGRTGGSETEIVYTQQRSGELRGSKEATFVPLVLRKCTSQIEFVPAYQSDSDGHQH